MIDLLADCDDEVPCSQEGTCHKDDEAPTGSGPVDESLPVIDGHILAFQALGPDYLVSLISLNPPCVKQRNSSEQEEM